MPQSPTRDEFSFLIGKALTAATFGESHTELRFDADVRIAVSGDIEHRLHADTLGRAVPETRALPSLAHLVGMKVRQVGAERDYLLLAFEDGHELRLFGKASEGGAKILPG